MAESSGAAPVTPLRVQSSSRLAFGVTTAALVTLASGGTAVLVSHGTSGLGSATSLPAGAVPRDAGSAPAPLVVGGPVASTAPTAAEQILREALALRPQPGPRVLTVPLVPLGPIGLVVDDGTGLPVALPTAVPTPPTDGPLLPPVVVPPVDLPGVHVPGVHTPGVHTPGLHMDRKAPKADDDDGPGDPHRRHGRAEGHEKPDTKPGAKPDNRPDTRPDTKAHPRGAAKGKHARGGRHSR